jgi:hypothetical protein
MSDLALSSCTPAAAPSLDQPEVIQAVEPAPSVASLLSESRAHAENRKRLANRTSAGQHTPNYAQAVVEAQSALSKRLQAHDLDPDHLSPAWAADVAPHDQIVAFLTAYPGIA